MRGGPSGRAAWPLWAIWLPCMLALAASGLLVIADALAGVMGSWDTPAPGLGWIKVAVAGHCALGVASLVLLAAGLKRSAWRRAAAMGAWLIIPVGVGWLVLAGHLASGG